jgi:hypothetical protein
MAIPGPANSFTLDQLLDMPIEQLLRLEITSRPPAKVAAVDPPTLKTEYRDAA